jgi:hypothetical protein
MNAERRGAVIEFLTFLVLAAGAGPTVAQTTVAADFRVESASVNRQASLLGADLRQPVSALLVKKAQDAFPYLAWKTAAEAGPGTARLVLALRDGEIGLCRPPAISLDLLGGDDAGEVLLAPKPFIPACDVAALAAPEQTYLEKISKAINELFADRVVLATIQEKLLARIVLTRKIEPDPANKQLFLPIRAEVLRAGLGSTLVAFYGEQGSNGALYMQPRSLTGSRTRVFLRKFSCGSDIEVGAEDAEGTSWPDTFVKFLDTCRQDPLVVMTKYEPGLAPIVPDPGGGGQ